MEFTFRGAMHLVMTEERVNECHQAVTKCVVKGPYPFPKVEDPHFRMVGMHSVLQTGFKMRGLVMMHVFYV